MLACQLVNMLTRQHVNMSAYQLVNMLTCQQVNLSTCQHVIMATCQLVNMSTCQHVNMSNCQLLNFTLVSKWVGGWAEFRIWYIGAFYHVILSTCQPVNMSMRQLVKVSACQHVKTFSMKTFLIWHRLQSDVFFTSRIQVFVILLSFSDLAHSTPNWPFRQTAQ